MIGSNPPGRKPALLRNDPVCAKIARDSSQSMSLRMRSTALLVIALACTTTGAAAQQTLAPQSRVRVALPEGQVLEGRAVGGDAATLTVRIEPTGELRTVQREQILLLTTMSESAASDPLRTSFLAGAVVAVASGSATAKCSYTRHCGPSPIIALAAGTLTTVVLSIARAEVIPQSTTAWRVVPNSVAISGAAIGVTASESQCRLLPSLEIRAGFSGAGSGTRAAAASLFCYGRISTGLEAGVVRDLEARGFGPQIYGYRSDVGRTTFVGAFAQYLIPGPGNVRAIISGGQYRRSDRRTLTTYSGEPNQETLVQTYSGTEPGIGAGLSVSFPVWRMVSLGFSTRGHFLLGDQGGTIGTFEASLKIRP
jgi:hypothetical protein